MKFRERFILTGAETRDVNFGASRVVYSDVREALSNGRLMLDNAGFKQCGVLIWRPVLFLERGAEQPIQVSTESPIEVKVEPNAATQIADLKAEIVRLKAEIYDLQHEPHPGKK